MNALLSVMGLYIADNTLFDSMVLPGQLRKDVMINLLLADLAELNTIYSDPDVMKFMITNWSKSRQDIWQHWADTKDYEYNPIWNKDGTYTETETRNLKGATSGKAKSGSEAHAVTERQRSAFDSSGYQPSEKELYDSEDNQISSETSGQTTDTGTITRQRVEKGNIGVTTTQQMIQEERDIADFDLYKIIIDEFKNRFCIMVY